MTIDETLKSTSQLCVELQSIADLFARRAQAPNFVVEGKLSNNGQAYEVVIKDHTGKNRPDYPLISCIGQEKGYIHHEGTLRLAEQQFCDIAIAIENILLSYGFLPSERKIQHQYIADFHDNKILPFNRQNNQ